MPPGKVVDASVTSPLLESFLFPSLILMALLPVLFVSLTLESSALWKNPLHPSATSSVVPLDVSISLDGENWLLRLCDTWFCYCSLLRGDQLCWVLSLSQDLVLRPHLWLANTSWKAGSPQCTSARSFILWCFRILFLMTSLILWNMYLFVLIYFAFLMVFWGNNCSALKLSLFLRSKRFHSVLSDLPEVESQHYYLKTIIRQLGRTNQPANK